MNRSPWLKYMAKPCSLLIPTLNLSGWPLFCSKPMYLLPQVTRSSIMLVYGQSAIKRLPKRPVSFVGWATISNPPGDKTVSVQGASLTSQAAQLVILCVRLTLLESGSKVIAISN
ncbi:MAG: hypothetical protein EGR97_01030 [Clostridiales bacterium]|nr:hypothetical protein [Clostridiales bacterium]